MRARGDYPNSKYAEGMPRGMWLHCVCDIWGTERHIPWHTESGHHSRQPCRLSRRLRSRRNRNAIWVCRGSERIHDQHWEVLSEGRYGCRGFIETSPSTHSQPLSEPSSSSRRKRWRSWKRIRKRSPRQRVAGHELKLRKNIHFWLNVNVTANAHSESIFKYLNRTTLFNPFPRLELHILKFIKFRLSTLTTFHCRQTWSEFTFITYDLNNFSYSFCKVQRYSATASKCQTWVDSHMPPV